MKDRIVILANDALTSELELGDNSSWGIGPGEKKSDAELLDAIDRGNYKGGRSGRKLSFFFFFLPIKRIQWLNLCIGQVCGLLIL